MSEHRWEAVGTPYAPAVPSVIFGRRDAANAILKPLPSGSLAVEQIG
jgi:hypothetical protein